MNTLELIIHAMKTLVSMAKHKHCTWHIGESFRKRPKPSKCITYYWPAARAIIICEVEEKIQNMKKKDEPSYNLIMKNKDAKSWSKAFYSYHH